MTIFTNTIENKEDIISKDVSHDDNSTLSHLQVGEIEMTLEPSEVLEKSEYRKNENCLDQTDPSVD